MLSADEDETARLIKRQRLIQKGLLLLIGKTPGSINLLLIASLATGRSPAEIAGNRRRQFRKIKGVFDRLLKRISASYQNQKEGTGAEHGFCP